MNLYQQWIERAPVAMMDAPLVEKLSYLFLAMADQAGALTNESEWVNRLGLTAEEADLAVQVYALLHITNPESE